MVIDWRNRGQEVRVRESGKPKGEAGIRIQGAVSNSVQVRPERMGVILRLSKEHSQPLLVTVWMMRRQGTQL